MELHPGPVHLLPTLWGMSRKAQRQGQLIQNPLNFSVTNKSASLGELVNGWGKECVLWIKMTGFTARTNHTICEVRL